MRHTRHFLFLVIASALGLALLSGCGNKGPLFIPEPPAEPQSGLQAP